MKQLIFASLVLLLSATAAQAQFFSLGIKGGMNTQVNTPDGITIPGENGFDFAVKDMKFGTQFGTYLRLGNKIFLQPELLFNSTRTDYVIGESSLGEVVKNERYNYLDIPILVGVKTGPVRFMAGPVGHRFISSRSELTDVDGYSAKFKEMTWGWQAGLSIGTGRISADIRYEGNFNKQGDHINFFGQPYHFSNNPARLIVGVNIALIK
jgi:hypothetical protein